MDMTYDENKKYEVWYEGDRIHWINPQMAKRQKLSDEGLENLKAMHCERLKLYARISFFIGAEETDYIPSLMKEYTALEYKMQECWGFPKDAGYHRFWDIPACTCPRMDNEDRLGTKYSIFSQECPLHGWE
jgi:hypothetical protein